MDSSSNTSALNQAQFIISNILYIPKPRTGVRWWQFQRKGMSWWVLLIMKNRKINFTMIGKTDNRVEIEVKCIPDG